MPYARINGEDLEYSIQGSREGEPVILIHGGMFADMYVPLISQPILADNHHLVTYHRRGYPGSSHNALDNVSIQQQAADCRELMQILNVDAIDASDMVHSLSPLEPALIGFIPSGSQFAKRLATVAGLLQEGKKPEALDFFLQTVFQVVRNIVG
jgi:pimeloyl-ACP methyl ester carboxylesterase